MTKPTSEETTNEAPTIAVLDFETDPFLFGRTPRPFAAMLLCGDGLSFTRWGDDCVENILRDLAGIEKPLVVYAHNGGKFDFRFFISRLENPLLIIHGRIAKAKFGIHEFRDSFLLFPMALSAYKKDEIDYSWFEGDQREAHKDAILKYLHGDCTYLLELLVAYTGRFGMGMTMPSTAIKQVKKLVKQKWGGETNDERFRPYYFGGRVQCFENGILEAPKGKQWEVFDTNSMYPYVMKNANHPYQLTYTEFRGAGSTPDGWIHGLRGVEYFAEMECDSNGALPLRDEKKALRFPKGRNEFFACSHEVVAGAELGLIKNIRFKRVWLWGKTQTFGAFVDKFMAEKIKAEQEKDPIARLLAKLMLNSAYGKFGQDPRRFCDYHLQVFGRDERPEGPEWVVQSQCEEFIVWKRPVESHRFFDVAVAASVTSAARAVLLRGLNRATSPVYCDTDSIICQGLDMPLHATELGAWKTEAEGDTLAIAGKKLYALFKDGKPVKSASKGVKISPFEIMRVAQGETIEWESAAPCFGLDGMATFTRRRSKMTQ